ncbi:hypothetical protein Nepgr_024214 [Nepenthes gracilis]|uniref:PGG domain-containing protein n=1 Tax=Nepenthes gracilis TaxID=150966 RepID=A0AAD3T5N4_NEPGR|nr:hypothetical protein Nepgr_024214 [Nepenthes gracilis]
MEGEQRQGKGMDERDDERETLSIENEDIAKAADADADGSNNPENLAQSDLDLLEQTAITSRSLRRRALSKSRSRFVEDYSKNGRSFPEILSPRVQKVTVRDQNDSVDRKKNVIKYSNMHMEALQNARNTITVSAILIATVAFGGCTNPPGGLHQDGPLIGKPTLGRAAAFKVFVISNDVAMFLSLSIVLVLVSIIPFKRKPLRRLLAVIHKVMWVAVGFMITAYIAARWAIMDQTQEGGWMFATLVSVCGGLLAAVFVGLSMMVVRDRLKKWKSRERRRMNQIKSGIGSLSKSSSSVSYIADFLEKGYHSY